MAIYPKDKASITKTTKWTVKLTVSSVSLNAHILSKGLVLVDLPGTSGRKPTFLLQGLIRWRRASRLEHGSTKGYRRLHETMRRDFCRLSNWSSRVRRCGAGHISHGQAPPRDRHHLHKIRGGCFVSVLKRKKQKTV